jgi:hypothetical protein
MPSDWRTPFKLTNELKRPFMPIKDYISSKKATAEYERWLKENNKQTGKNYVAENGHSVSEVMPDVKLSN